jgi:hypothetical protein
VKAWLRLTVIARTVGGGVTGISVTARYLFEATDGWFLYLVGLAVFAFIAAGGLFFVHNPRAIRVVLIAFALQIPWISTPLITYQLYSACGASIGVMDGKFQGEIAWVGSRWELSLFKGGDWGLGINLIAAVIFMFLWRSAGILRKKQEKERALITSVPLLGVNEHGDSAGGPH